MTKSEKESGPTMTAADKLEEAFKEYELTEVKTRPRAKILEDTKLQLASAHTRINEHEPSVFELPEHYVVYAKLHFDKPTYRKLAYLSQLYDEPLIRTITDMIEHELAGELNNTDELGARIKQRILEEAYQLGKEPQLARRKKLQEVGRTFPP